MSVIGRMDKQVDDVLISPVARKNQQARETPEGDEKTATRDESLLERETPPSRNRTTGQNDLPVWLL
jgi:hypothetical protein